MSFFFFFFDCSLFRLLTFFLTKYSNKSIVSLPEREGAHPLATEVLEALWIWCRALFVWEWPTLPDWSWHLCLQVSACGGHVQHGPGEHPEGRPRRPSESQQWGQRQWRWLSWYLHPHQSSQQPPNVLGWATRAVRLHVDIEPRQCPAVEVCEQLFAAAPLHQWDHQDRQRSSVCQHGEKHQVGNWGLSAGWDSPTHRIHEPAWAARGSRGPRSGQLRSPWPSFLHGEPAGWGRAGGGA